MKDVSITSWPHSRFPREAELQELYVAEGLAPYRWSNAPHDHYPAHAHTYHKVIYVVSGSISFGLPQTGESFTLVAGDRLDLPRGTVHDALVGPDGVVYLEGHHD